MDRRDARERCGWRGQNAGVRSHLDTLIPLLLLPSESVSDIYTIHEHWTLSLFLCFPSKKEQQSRLGDEFAPLYQNRRERQRQKT